MYVLSVFGVRRFPLAEDGSWRRFPRSVLSVLPVCLFSPFLVLSLSSCGHGLRFRAKYGARRFCVLVARSRGYSCLCMLLSYHDITTLHLVMLLMFKFLNILKILGGCFVFKFNSSILIFFCL